MHDSRLEKLADVLTAHSTKVQPGEYVLIEGFDIPEEMIIALIRTVRAAWRYTARRGQAEPYPTGKLLRDADEEGLKLIGEYEAYRMKQVQAYIGIRGQPEHC